MARRTKMIVPMPVPAEALAGFVSQLPACLSPSRSNDMVFRPDAAATPGQVEVAA